MGDENAINMEPQWHSISVRFLEHGVRYRAAHLKALYDLLEFGVGRIVSNLVESLGRAERDIRYNRNESASGNP
jgi:hypothetical protein